MGQTLNIATCKKLGACQDPCSVDDDLHVGAKPIDIIIQRSSQEGMLLHEQVPFPENDSFLHEDWELRTEQKFGKPMSMREALVCMQKSQMTQGSQSAVSEVNVNSEPSLVLELQGGEAIWGPMDRGASIGQISECYGLHHMSDSSSLPSDASARSEKSRSRKKKEMTALVKEFRAEAHSGIPCKVYRKESDVFVFQPCTMFLNADGETIRLSLDKSDQDFELPLMSFHVFEEKQLKKQSSSFDDATVEALRHNDPCHALHLSVFLASHDESHCIVLKDQKTMNKCRVALQFLSFFSREKVIRAVATDKMLGA